ncbi:hypothetical protein ACFPVT_07780 [Corynebacterium choanae]|uniref:GHMP family kinase ATP-binding protein n=1 Tax=Corynebacterium choanae TaxID=1862358 RepID=UPI0019D20112|nr:hypothetical protein [Corynebacterium choanae]
MTSAFDTSIVNISETHQQRVGCEPDAVAIAPETVGIIGDQSDLLGGTVVAALGQRHVTVAVSRRHDDEVRVTSSKPFFQAATTSTSRMPADLLSVTPSLKAPQRAGGILPWNGAAPETTVAETVTLADFVVGLVTNLIYKQHLPRDVHGFDVTIISEIPAGSGLGEHEALVCALLLAMQELYNGEPDVTTRTKLIDVAMLTPLTVVQIPLQRYRIATILRGFAARACLVQQAVEAVEPLPDPMMEEWEMLVINGSLAARDRTVSRKEYQRRADFFQAAQQAFLLSSLLQLPDANERIIDWLAAVREVRGTAGTPLETEASQWLQLALSEASRATEFAALTRSRGESQALALLQQSQQGIANQWALTGQAPLVDELLSCGVSAVRPAAWGLVDAQVVWVLRERLPEVVDQLAAYGDVHVVAPGAPGEGRQLRQRN